MSRLPWKPLLALAAVAAVGLAAAGVQQQAKIRVERRLQAEGLDFDGQRQGVGRLRWWGLQGEGLSAEALDLNLLQPGMQLSGLDLDIERLLPRLEAQVRGSAPGEGPEGSLSAASLPVRVDGLRLRWGADVLATGLSGSLRPQVALTGPDASLRQEADGSWEGRLDHTLRLGPLSGMARLSLRCDPAGQGCTADLRMAEATLQHPLLAPAPLTGLDLHGTATLDRAAAQASGSLRLGDLRGRFTVDGSGEGLATLEAQDLPLGAVAALFGDQVPEARRASLDGTLGFSARFGGPDWRLLAFSPQASGLAASGVLADPDGLKGGELTFRAPLEGGEWVPHTVGPGRPGWVGLRQAGLVPAAMIAAEDSAFLRHQGFHLPAIQAAVDEHIADPTGDLRGGSTITQQLAKNLFCDPLDRSLARKLRELLFALEMEQVLPKERILELYINIVELGPEIIGVGPAADAYFIKTPDRLTPGEAVFLAAILPSPRRGYHRAVADRPPAARMATILDNMVAGAALDHPTAEAAKRAPLRIVPLER